MGLIKPSDISFKISDNGFYLDGSLTAIVDGSAYDFMGREIFTTGFFRDNIGFGITAVDVELNTNLNPIITITFKDLYGNTMFGKNQFSDIVNYKVLFNWPPPKFLFTFKGYLGSQVTWLLTLKNTSTTYQSDGSYDIKCEFIPNQWGFMADLPFMFLLAVKGLRKKELNDSDFKTVRSIFDLIKIGRKVEVQTKEVSAEFDILQQQMTLLKSNRIVEALAYSRIIKLDQAIDGTFGNSKIKSSGTLNYSTITIKTPSAPIETIEKLKAYTSTNAEALRKANTYLLLNAEFEGVKPLNISLDEINFDGGGFKEVEVKQRIDIINNNLKIIQDTIKDRIYKASKSQLRQITIGEIFQQLAKDSAYLMGRILKAGEKGYLNNTDRDAALESQKIINKHFPLMIEGEEKDEVPAKGYGVEDYEMAFVNQFITAVSEGVAKDLVQPSSDVANQENTLVKRINNVEGPKGNPYKPFFRNIAQNVLVRAGIIGFLTRSNDPNYPGDYDATWGGDRESVEEVLKLAASDMENITVNMLSELNEKETIQLKQFCTYWENFTSDNGYFFLKQDGTKGFDGIIPRVDIDTEISSDITGRAIIVDKASKTTKTLDDIFNMVFSGIRDVEVEGSGLANSVIDSSNYQFIDYGQFGTRKKSFQAQAIYNNGILYRVPQTNKDDDDYAFVLFEGNDSSKVRGVNSADSDGEAKSADPDASSFWTGKDNLLGYVPIDTYNGNDDKKLPRIAYMESRLAVALLKYSAMSNPEPGAWSDEDSWMETCVYPTDAQFVDPNLTSTGDASKEIPTVDITVSVAFHPYTGDQGLVFGPFYNSVSGRNHLACIKKMCVIILSKFQQLEDEKNKFISDILSQAEGGKNALYKQFNILYHQWETLLFTSSNNTSNNKTFDRLGPEEIVPNLEERFGGDTQHRTPNSGDKKASVSSYKNCTFVYDYPLNNTAKLNVKNAIINIEPLYKADSNTTVLNIIQQTCEKNNFMFIPIPGNGDFNDCTDIFKPQISQDVALKNLFYIMFAPTPESRTKLDNKDAAVLSQSVDVNVTDDVMEVQVGSPFNKIFKSVDIETREQKVVAESIVNLQRLTDNENQNKRVTTDCSLLPVMEGRSCKTTFEMLGNAQVFPMQYFYLNSVPLFNGLYQILTVNHSITPNDMTTKAQGVRMRFAPGDSGGVQPVTLESFENKKVTIEEIEAGGIKGREVADRQASTTPSDDSGAVSSSNPGTSNNGVANTLDQCTPVTGELKENFVKSTIVKNEYGGYIQGKSSFIAKVEKAYNVLKAQGITLKIGDSTRSFSFQKSAYENYLKNVELQKAGKSWTKNGKTYPASKKPDNIANPCSGYHVRGQAIDLAQSAEQMKDIRSHGKIYKALYDVGLRRVPNEWWHWSLGEATHGLNEAAGKAKWPNSLEYSNFTKY